MTDSPDRLLGLSHQPGHRRWSTHPQRHRREHQEPTDPRFLRSQQRAPSGVGVKDLRPLRGRPSGPILDPDASAQRAQEQAENRQRKDQRPRARLGRVDRPRSFRNDCRRVICQSSSTTVRGGRPTGAVPAVGLGRVRSSHELKTAPVVGDRGCVVAKGIGVKAAGAHDDVVWDAAAGRDPRREALDMEAAIADALARNTRLRRHRVTITVGPDGLVTLTGPCRRRACGGRSSCPVGRFLGSGVCTTT